MASSGKVLGTPWTSWREGEGGQGALQASHVRPALSWGYKFVKRFRAFLQQQQKKTSAPAKKPGILAAMALKNISETPWFLVYCIPEKGLGITTYSTDDNLYGSPDEIHGEGKLVTVQEAVPKGGGHRRAIVFINTNIF